MTTSVRSLAEQQKFARIFFHYHLFSFLFYSEQQKFARIFCAFSSFNHSHVSSLAMVQPVSAILIFDLGFRLNSRQSIIYGSTRPRFIRLRLRSYALRVLFLPSIHPSSRLVASTFRPRQYHSSFLALLGVPCIQCSRWV